MEESGGVLWAEDRGYIKVWRLILSGEEFGVETGDEVGRPL